jgi:hypothetical protein
MSFDGFLAEFIGVSMTDAGLHAGTGHPAGEAVGIVIAALRAFLEEGHAAELGAPDDERVLQQAALFQVADQSGGGLVEDVRMHVILRLEIAVAVPVEFAAAGIGTVEELHETHAALDEATGEDAVLREGGLVGVLRVVRAIELQDVRGLGAEVVDLGHAELHARGEFVAGDACGELLIAWMAPDGVRSSFAAATARLDRPARRHAGRGEMPHGAFGTHRGALKGGGEKPGPQLFAPFCGTPRGSGMAT